MRRVKLIVVAPNKKLLLRRLRRIVYCEDALLSFYYDILFFYDLSIGRFLLLLNAPQSYLTFYRVILNKMSNITFVYKIIMYKSLLYALFLYVTRRTFLFKKYDNAYKHR